MYIGINISSIQLQDIKWVYVSRGPRIEVSVGSCLLSWTLSKTSLARMLGIQGERDSVRVEPCKGFSR